VGQKASIVNHRLRKEKFDLFVRIERARQGGPVLGTGGKVYTGPTRENRTFLGGKMYIA